jgi:hypothetical protein
MTELTIPKMRARPPTQPNIGPTKDGFARKKISQRTIQLTTKATKAAHADLG